MQTEKQRLIWAYKILFLDVLFPLNVRKVIFCDSDQVVRGNMAELWNMDLHVITFPPWGGGRAPPPPPPPPAASAPRQTPHQQRAGRTAPQVKRTS